MTTASAIEADEQTNNMSIRNTLMETYAKRALYIRNLSTVEQQHVLDMNFMVFGSTYTAKLLSVRGTTEKRLIKHRNLDNICMRIYQNFSSDSKSNSYGKYCKFQLLRYKVKITITDYYLTFIFRSIKTVYLKPLD